MKRIKVSVTVADRKVTLEGPEDFVRTEVERLTGSGERNHAAENRGSRMESKTEKSPRSEREFCQEKKPKGHAETVAVLAFCLREAGMPEFTPEDMRKAYIRAGIRPPKVVAQALRDAKNKNDYIAGAERGTFRLSPHGERTVLFDLPL